MYEWRGVDRTTDKGDGVLADVAVPDVVGRTGTKAVNAFSLVGTDDDVGQSASLFDDEHGFSSAGLGLFLTDPG